jgi:ribosomal protein S18 acetylase RimI-like enzyme
VVLFADASLARRLERDAALLSVDYANTMQELYPDSGARALPVGGGYAVFGGRSLSINRAASLGLSAAVTGEDLDSVEQFYAEVGLPTRLDLCPLADPSLAALLGQRGYRVDHFFNALFRSLKVEDTFLAPGGDISVQAVEASDAELWARTAAMGFLGTDEVAEDDMSLLLGRLAFHQPTVVPFLARVGDAPAGVVALSVREGVAGIFSMSTRPAYRRRGVQTTLLASCLAKAAARDCDVARVITDPGSASQRNFERAGYRVAYTRPTVSREAAGEGFGGLVVGRGGRSLLCQGLMAWQ